MIKETLLYSSPAFLKYTIYIFALPLFTRNIPIEEYGALSLLGGFVTMFDFILYLANSMGFYRLFFVYIKRPEKQKKLLLSLNFFSALTFLSMACLSFLFKDKMTFLISGSEKYSNLIPPLFLLGGIQSIAGTVRTFLINDLKSKTYAIFSNISLVSTIAIGLIMACVFHMGILSIVYSTIIGELIFFFLGIRILYPKEKKIDFKFYKKSFLFGSPQIFSTMFGRVVGQLERYNDNNASGLVGMGVQSMSNRVTGAVGTMGAAIGNVYLPRIFRSLENKTECKKEITQFFFYNCMFNVGVCIFIEDALRIFTTKDYYDAKYLVYITALASIFSLFGTVFNQCIIYKNKIKTQSAIQCFSVLLQLCLVFTIVRKYGIYGSAFSCVISSFVVSCVDSFLGYRLTKIKVDWIKVFSIVTCSILMISLTYLGIQKLIICIFYFCLLIYFLYERKRFI